MPFTIGGKWIPSKQGQGHSKKISVMKQTRKGRVLTLVKNVDGHKIDPKELLKLFKTKCHCGGTLQNEVLELQGDHEEKVKMILKQKELL